MAAMKFYRATDGVVWAFESDGSQDELISEDMTQMTEEEIYVHLNPPPTHEEILISESKWVEAQMTRVANQLLMIEDEDPDAEPGTARQWRDYRIELRKWNEVSPDFPDSSKRPVAPI